MEGLFCDFILKIFRQNDFQNGKRLNVYEVIDMLGSNSGSYVVESKFEGDDSYYFMIFL